MTVSRFLRIRPRYLRLTLTPEEQRAVDDALVARGIDLGDAIGWEEPRTGLFDLDRGAAPLIEIADATLGRAPASIASVEGLVPFDWRSFDGARALEQAMPRLPGYLVAPGPFRYFGADESHPPFLWASHEAPGLQVQGTLDEDDLRAWLAAFGAETSSWPLRPAW